MAVIHHHPEPWAFREIMDMGISKLVLQLRVMEKSYMALKSTHSRLESGSRSIPCFCSSCQWVACKVRSGWLEDGTTEDFEAVIFCH